MNRWCSIYYQLQAPWKACYIAWLEEHNSTDARSSLLAFVFCTRKAFKSVLTVVKFQSEAGENQWIFASKWTSSKNFVISFKTIKWRAAKKWLVYVFSANFQDRKTTFLYRSFFHQNIELFRTEFIDDIVNFIHF